MNMADNVTNNDGDDALISHTTNDNDTDTVTDVVNHVQQEDHPFEYCDESKCVSSLLLVPVQHVGGRTVVGEDDAGSGNEHHDDNNDNKVPTFTCYAEGNAMSPFACAEGYTGFVIDSEPLFLYQDTYLSYYTCCLPSSTPVPLPVALSVLSNSTNITEQLNESSSSSSSSSSVASMYQRHCSNTIVIGSNNNEEEQEERGGGRGDRMETNVCDGGTRSSRATNAFDHSILEKKYLRPMTKNFGHLESYTCCDEELVVPSLLLPASSSLNNNTSTSSTLSKLFPFTLEDVECVPYLCIDVFDYDCISKNRYGALMTMSCRDDLYNGVFIFPKIVATTTDKDEIRFECCKTGTHTHLLPMQAPAFQKTYYVHVVLSSLALVSLLILIVGILKGKKKEAATTSLRATSTSITRRSSTMTQRSRSFTSRSLSFKRVSSATRPSMISRSSSMASLSRSIRQQQKHSPYNLYLVFMALPDVVLSTFMMWRCVSALTGHTFENHTTWTILDWNGTTDLARYSGAIFWTCSTANVGMNCVIAWEVFQFLQNSFQLVRNPQPSVRKVSLQAAVVYVYAMVVNVIVFSCFAKYRGTPEVYYVMTYGYPLLLVCTFLGPCLFLLVICFLIWQRGYILNTDDKRYKYLALYFLRIVVAFLLLWVPTSVLVILHLLPVPIGYAEGASPVFAMYAHDDESSVALPVYAISMILISLQALLTVVMALLKPDVRNMVLELFTSCCCCCSFCQDHSHNEIQGSQCNNHNSSILLPTQELEDSIPIVIHKIEEHKVDDDDKARTTSTQELDLDLQMPQVDDDDDDDDDSNDPQHQV